jgi:hypothetical protein
VLGAGVNETENVYKVWSENLEEKRLVRKK